MSTPDHDPINHPKHYTSHPSGVECIDVTRHMTFNIGNVVKYCWRSGLKDGNPSVQDLRKAAWYLNDEIRRLEGKPEHVLDMAPGEGIATIRKQQIDGLLESMSDNPLNDPDKFHEERCRKEYQRLAAEKGGINEVARAINEAVNSVPTDSEALWHPKGQDATLTGESLDAIEAELKKVASTVEMVDGKPYYLGIPYHVHEVGKEWNAMKIWEPHSVVRWQGRLWQMLANTPYNTVSPDRSAYWTLLPE